jgi:hypothetical protein
MGPSARASELTSARPGLGPGRADFRIGVPAAYAEKAGISRFPVALARLITRREKPEDFKQALERISDDIKVVIQFGEV